MSIATLQRRLGLLTVTVLPVAFVLVSWWAAAGFPYYLDNNETFLSYVHARNLELWNPNEYGWLTAEGTDPRHSSIVDVYTHNPNGPRYLHYLLLRLGLRDITAQTLALALLGTALTGWLLWRTFGRPGMTVVALAVALDYVGFLAWTVNTYRVWVFVLFFGLVLATARKSRGWTAVLMFLVFQIEYGTALFVGVTVTVLALMLHGWGARWLIVASAAGAILSVGLFAAQVLAYYGPDGFLHELATTYTRRGTAGSEAGASRFVFQAWHGLYELAMSIARDTYSRPVLLLTVAGVGFSVLMLRRQTSTPPERFLAAITLSVVLGCLATSTLLYGYFLNGFVFSLLPLTTFLIAPALGVVALELQRLVQLRYTPAHVGVACAGLVLLPLGLSSAMHFEPPVAVPLFQLLRSELHGRATASPALGAAMMGPELAFAFTDGRAAAASDIDATPADVARLSEIRDADGRLTYVCLDTLYVRQRHKAGAFSVCEIAAARMTQRGHEEIASGLGWTVIQVNPTEQALTGPGVAATDRGGQP